MSTRCQLRVMDGHEDKKWSQSITLYHHADGYPSYIVPNIREAYKISKGEWEAGRPGKVASFLCAADPGIWEPLPYHDLHGDIEFYYKLYIVDGGDKSISAGPKWEVEIYRPRLDRMDWHALDEDGLELVQERMPIEMSVT